MASPAANCFWSHKDRRVNSASNYAVAVGKVYRPWDDERDCDAQKSDVRAVYLPDTFHGIENNLQADIAVVEVATAFEFTAYVRPVCLNFDYDFERHQLKTETAKVAGWGSITEDDYYSQALKVLDFMFIDLNDCYNNSPDHFTEFITTDKMCAKYTNNGTALCMGDSGDGLVFPQLEEGSVRYYLRGVTSGGPASDKACNLYTFNTFTQISKHDRFLQKYL